MLPTRLRSLQLELHIHRRWLSGFIQRTQASPFSTTFQRHAALKTAHSNAASKDAPIRRTKSSAQDKRYKQSKGHPRSRSANFIKAFGQEEPASPIVNPIVADLREKILAGNITHVIENYTALNQKDKESLERRDVRQLAQTLHHIVRKEKTSASNQNRQSTVRDLVEFAEILVKDIKAGSLAPIGKAHVHLIGIFKESGSREKGIQFWKWLAEQDEAYVDVDCYGAAIELFAYDGVPLAELERLYQEALGRFPGNFAAYHLRPDALLPDREEPFKVGGIPISLLQSILTARLLNGDTRNAYLALDTAMRLLPDQVPQRLFLMFLEERPLQEGYAVFALACRGGNVVPGAYYRRMLGALRTHASLNSPAQHALGVRAMLSASHMYIGNGGTVAGNSVNEVVIALTQFLRVEGVDGLTAKDKQKIVKAVMELVHGVFEIFARYGAKPGIPAFNSIITNLGGFGSSKQTIGVALKDADALGLAPTDVTWRSILAVGGMFQDKGLVEKTWAHLRDTRIEDEQNPTASDFHAFVKPAHLSGAVAFAQEELDKLRDILGPDAYESIAYRLEDTSEAEVHAAENAQPVDMAAMLAEIEKVKADIEIIKTRTQDSPALQDFSSQALPLTLQPQSSELELPESQLRKIYDDLTTEAPAQTDSISEAAASELDSVNDILSSANGPLPSSDESLLPNATSIAKSKTNIPFGTLRFESWKMINYLLELSEKHDHAYHERVDEAIAAGRVPPKRLRGVGGKGKEVVSWGLSSVGQGQEGWKEGWKEGMKGEVGQEEFKRVREEIMRLRGRFGGV